VLSGRVFCDELTTRPEKSYRPWRVVVCDLETSRMRRPWPTLGRSGERNKKELECNCTVRFRVRGAIISLVQGEFKKFIMYDVI